jgi:hypothetical protein
MATMLSIARWSAPQAEMIQRRRPVAVKLQSAGFIAPVLQALRLRCAAAVARDVP